MTTALKLNILLLLIVGGLGQCPCPKILKPVCGSDGVTYNNDCLATCAHADVAYDGKCVSGDKRGLPTCKNPINCAAAPCSVSSSPCKGREDLICRNSYCNEDTKLDGYTIPGGCTAVYLTKTAGLIAPACLPNNDCVCPAIAAPVCGVDGKDYGNACEAGCWKVPVAYKGECKLDCKLVMCGNQDEPVCGKDGKTYKNKCEAQCLKKAEIAYDGACKPPKIDCRVVRCSNDHEPVCGADGKTYQNNCQAQCVSNVVVKGYGECKSEEVPNCAAVVCPVDGDPVCGTNKKTYPNDCLAKCDGAKIAYKGECKTSGCAGTSCSSRYDPVCGTNKKTYPNGCLAKCDGAKIAYKGECKKPCTCKHNGGWVCGRNGKSYKSTCAARCAGAAVAYTGKCKPPKITSIPCSRNDPGVRCLVDPCKARNSCRNQSNAVCLAFYCKKPVTYQGVQITKSCSSVYVSKQTGVIMPECK